ncbi:Polyprenyl synthetase, partial [Cynara cardunculus var. scolymus]
MSKHLVTRSQYSYPNLTVCVSLFLQMLDYNVPGGEISCSIPIQETLSFHICFVRGNMMYAGKLNRGLSVVDSYKLLKGDELTDDEVFLACALGWCVEWLQAYFLVLDDIMDESHTRRGQPCWFRLPKVGMIAVNDGVVLRNHVPRILKKHFRGKAYYADLLDLFNEVEFQTASGQMIDLITTLVGEKDLSNHRRIVQFKTAYYSFYLPIGTDIEDFKCSWLVVKALELANEEQKKLLHEKYGRKDPASVAKVKELYYTLNLEVAAAGVSEDYENKSHEKLIKSIESHPSKAVQA